MKRTISLKNIHFYAFHGVLPEENIVGAEYLVNLSFDYDFSLAAERDDLSGTINYADVYELVKREMSLPSKLIEHVANRIFNSIKEKYSGISKLKVSVSKLNPPITGNVEAACVEISE